MNQLRHAHEIVANRKKSVGIASVTDVIMGSQQLTKSADNSSNGMYVGTNLTKEDVSEWSELLSETILAVLIAGRYESIIEAVQSAAVEGLLVGIEHGKAIK